MAMLSSQAGPASFLSHPIFYCWLISTSCLKNWLLPLGAPESENSQDNKTSLHNIDCGLDNCLAGNLTMVTCCFYYPILLLAMSPCSICVYGDQIHSPCRNLHLPELRPGWDQEVGGGQTQLPLQVRYQHPLLPEL